MRDVLAVVLLVRWEKASTLNWLWDLSFGYWGSAVSGAVCRAATGCAACRAAGAPCHATTGRAACRAAATPWLLRPSHVSCLPVILF